MRNSMPNSKFEIRNTKQILNLKSEIQNEKKAKRYDLEDRTFNFAQRVMDYVSMLPKNEINTEIGKQLVRAGGLVGANYIEANESLGKKDFLMKIKISRKESKESRFWVKLSRPLEEKFCEKEFLIKESTELMNIFGAILRNSDSSSKF